MGHTLHTRRRAASQTVAWWLLTRVCVVLRLPVPGVASSLLCVCLRVRHPGQAGRQVSSACLCLCLRLCLLLCLCPTVSLSLSTLCVCACASVRAPLAFFWVSAPCAQIPYHFRPPTQLSEVSRVCACSQPDPTIILLNPSSFIRRHGYGCVLTLSSL